MTFGEYLIMKAVSSQPETISESVAPAEIKRAVRKIEKELKGSYIEKLYKKFPKIQYCDVEEAFDEAMEEVKKNPPPSETSAKRAMRKRMEKILAHTNSRKRGARKSLSCVGAVKSMVGAGGTVASLIKRAEKILTNQELKVISLCSEGKPVRKIAEEIGTSFPTAWRVLNSALDKIRVSHGMRPRNLDRRKS
jgi:DNA-binding NarL/FixJ family response regulator